MINDPVLNGSSVAHTSQAGVGHVGYYILQKIKQY
jgi:hypothetical protein